MDVMCVFVDKQLFILEDSFLTSNRWSIFHHLAIGQSAPIGHFCIAVGPGLHREHRLGGMPPWKVNTYF